LRASGFTLVELLVVLVIAAALGGLALLALGTPGSEARPARVLERVATAMNAMCDRALLEARPYGIRFRRDGYDFWVFDAGGWRVLDDTGSLRSEAWPDGVDPRVEIERLDAYSASVGDAPQVWCTGVEPPPSVTLVVGGGAERRSLAWPR
jgi:prepilin-type N-terminal cleavage/methylation domain-containing protein